jgi:acyl carrier protein
MPSTELEVRGILTDQVIEILIQETAVLAMSAWDVLKSKLGLGPAPVPRAIIDPSADFVRDLHIDSDELSFDFVRAIHGKYGLKLSSAEWSKIGSVNDVVEALWRHGVRS